MIATKKICVAALSAALLLPTGLFAPTAEAGIGGGIGVTFPVSRSGTAGRTDSYAGVRVGDLSEELSVAEKGGRLLLTLKVRNEGDAPYTVEHPTGQNCDFVLLDAKGRELWRWSEGMSFTQAFQSFTLAPGASESFAAEIDRKTYRTLRDKAVLAVAGLTDTGIYLSAEVPDGTGGRRSPTWIHGDIIFGRGGWTRW